MANICSNHLHIEGNKEDIAPLRKAITNQDPELLELFYWFTFTDEDYGLWDDTFTPEEESICLSFGSNWSFPGGHFESLVAEYPRLTFEAYSEEAAMEFFLKVTASDGLACCEDLTPLDYYTAMNEDFATERKSIEELSYDEFLKYALDNKDEIDLDFLWCYLEPRIIDRIKRKDLPLFIDREWHSEEDTEKFTTKLKGE